MKNNRISLTNFNLVKNTDITIVFILVLIWIFLVVLVNPIGDFPLNDDWAYGWTVKTLLKKGDFQLSDWTATNLLSQVIWGSLFCLPFGFSFTALRFSTLILGLIGVLATYGLLREVNASSQISILGALIVALNPIYFELSNSFNSDVPSFAFAILSLYFLIKGLRVNSNLAIIIGLVLSYVSILNRQSSLIIIPAFGLGYLLKKGFNFRTVIEALSPTVLGIILHLSYSHWLQLTGRKPLLYNFQVEKLIESLSKGFPDIGLTYAKNLLIILVYLGLFLFSFLMISFYSHFKALSSRQKQISLFFTFFAVALGVVFIAKGNQMPLVGNTLEAFSLGPQQLDGYNSFLDLRSKALLSRSWKVLTLIGVLGAILLLQYLFLLIIQIFSNNSETKLNKQWLIPLIMSASSGFLYFLPIGGLDKNYWYDRYLILFLPLLMILVSLLVKTYQKTNFSSGLISLGLFMLLIYGGFTISATHDYLSWNRIRWQALDDLVQNSKILPNSINGGFEFNGWHFGNRLETCNPKHTQKSEKSPVSWSDFTCLWDNNNYEYRLSFVLKADYGVEKQYSFRRWLPWREQTLYVLHRNKTTNSNI